MIFLKSEYLEISSMSKVVSLMTPLKLPNSLTEKMYYFNKYTQDNIKSQRSWISFIFYKFREPISFLLTRINVSQVKYRTLHYL